MKLRVINGQRHILEEKVMQSMIDGTVCQEELDRLRPKGDLHLVEVEEPVSGTSDGESSERLAFDDLNF